MCFEWWKVYIGSCLFLGGWGHRWGHRGLREGALHGLGSCSCTWVLALKNAAVGDLVLVEGGSMGESERICARNCSEFRVVLLHQR